MKRIYCLFFILSFSPMSFGVGGASIDFNEIDILRLKKLELSAEQGDKEAQYQLGEHHSNKSQYQFRGQYNNNGKNHLDEAIKWFEKASEQGHLSAKYQLGIMYLNANGVITNNYKKQAIELFEEAAKQGHTMSQRKLGDIYFYGEGVVKDFAKASEWYNKADDKKNPCKIPFTPPTK